MKVIITGKPREDALSREKEEREFHLSLIENAETWIGKAMSAGTKREGEK